MDEYDREDPQTDLEMVAFSTAFIDSIVIQIKTKQGAGDVAFADDPLLEINFGTEYKGTYVKYDTVAGLTLTTDPPDPELSGEVVGVEDWENFELFSGLELNHTNTIPDNADSEDTGEGGGVFLEGFEASGDNLYVSLDNTAVPNGGYVVELFFAELGGTLNSQIPEQRLFDIKLEGVTVLEDYEIYDDHSDNGYGDPIGSTGEVAIGHLGSATQESGDNTPGFHGLHGVVKRFQVDVTDDDGLRIDLERDPSIGSRNPLINGLRILKVDEVGPWVTNVMISNSDPQSTHERYEFATAEVADLVTHVVEPVIGSGNQLRTVPVGGADTIEIVFSEDVDVSADQLSVTGLTSFHAATNEVTVPVLAENGFDYNSATKTAIWTFTSWDVGDFYLISLDDGVTDPAGQPLDGEWTNPASIYTENGDVSVFPSGDGLVGGDFNFVATILPGDASLDGIVDGLDAGIIIPNWLLLDQTFQDGDFNGDGIVNTSDVDYLFDNYQTYLRDLWILADLNGDYVIDGFEAGIISANLGRDPNMYEGDLNGDGVIDQDDLDLLIDQYGMQIDVVF